MKLNSISLKNYRNIKNLDIDFDDVNIIYGKNAQGKTNLIEAIYLFTGSRNFRGAQDKDLINFESDNTDLKINFISNGREQNAQININNGRKAYLNGIKQRSSSLLGEQIKAVIFSPVHLSIIKDGPNERRKFTDNALCQIKSNYANVLKEYKRTLVQRNTLLKEFSPYKNDNELLSVFDKKLALSGAKIIYQRQKYIENLLPYTQNIFEGLTGGKEKIDLKFNGCFDYQGLTTRQIEEQLAFYVEKNRENDINAKYTCCGPHKDDLNILINGKSSRIFASQGQQRSCVLALKLAEASLLKDITGDNPIALLDDVMSELDEQRQDYILNHIKDWQIFITCCDANTVLRLKKGKTIHISDGKIIED